jgi:hypothetical protein
LFGGNPVLEDNYLPERNAINGEKGDMVLGLQSTLIRNIAGWRYTVTDGEGNDLIDPVYGGAKYGAYYYANQQKWMNVTTQVGAKYAPTGLAEGDTVTFSVAYAPEYYVNDEGDIDWDALGYGAFESITATIDNTAPELIDACLEGYDPAAGTWTDLTVIAKDNQYIATIAVFNDEGDMLGYCEPDYDADPGEELTYTLNYAEEIEAYGFDAQTKLLVEVYDYASNVTTYKMNLDIEDISGDITVTIPESLVLVRGNTAKLTANVEPWGADDGILWESYDESIATVDQNGVVTAVADGTTYIFATSLADETAYAVCEVFVKSIEKTLNGVVWDEEGEVWFSKFNTNELPDYTKLTEESLNAPIASVTWGGDGNLYAASLYTDELVSDLYLVDPETFALTKIGGSDELAYMDIATETAFGGMFLIGVYGPYILIIDIESGDFLGYLDMSDSVGDGNFVGIALEAATPGMDIYFLVDDMGELYEIGIGPYNGSIGSTPLYDDGNFGYESDTPYFSSLYFDGESLFWSRFNDDKVDIIDFDLSDTQEVFQLGFFGEDVWPVGGLFELGETEPSGETGSFEGVLGAAELLTDAKPLALNGDKAKGTLNSIDASEPANPEDPSMPVYTPGDFTQVIELNADRTSTNGLITVEYDASKVSLESVKSSATYSTYVDDGAGTVTFAYITRTEKAFAPGDVIAELTFASNSTANATYTVTTNEVNNEHLTDATYDVEITNEHEYGDPVWNWSRNPETGAVEAAMTITCAAHEDCAVTCVAREGEASVPEKIGETAANCTDPATETYTATIVEGGVTYTDTHTFDVGVPLGHTMTKTDAVPATCEEDGNVEYYTCSVCKKIFADEAGSEELADTVDPATGHDWADQEGAAPATCTADGRDYRKCNNCGEVIDETIPATGHDMTYYPATVTCTKAGKIAYYECGNCGKIFADEAGETELTAEELNSERLGHAWNDGEVIKEPTCTGGGVMLYTCLNDANHTKTAYIDPLGHTIAEEPVAANDPTCTEDGNYAYYECTVCAAKFADPYGYNEYADVVIPALGHDFDDTIEANVTVVDATCTEAGSKTVKCSRCDETSVTTSEALGHDYKFDSFEWAENGRSAKAKLVCANDPTHVTYEDAELTITYHEGTAEKPAYLVYTASYGTEADEKIETEDGEEIPFLIGDVDLDGDVDPADARLALRIALGMMEDDGVTMGELNVKAADVDLKDGATPADARLILRYALGMTDPEWGGIAE